MSKIKNKNNIFNFIFILIVILLTVFLSAKVNYKYADSFKKSKEFEEKALIECQMSDSTREDYINWCEKLKNTHEDKQDFFSTYSNMIIFELKFLNPCTFLIVSIPTIFITYRRLKYGYFINANNRETYKKSLAKFFRDAYKYIWIIPLIALIIMIPIFFYTTLNPAYAIKYGTCIWETALIENPLLFFTLYLFNLILYAGFFTNVSLIVVRKKHNFFSAVILSYLLYVALELFNEVFIDVILFQNIFHSYNGGIFKIMNMFTFNTQYGTWWLILFSLAVYLISVIAVYFSYRDKEKLIIDCEKNNNKEGGQV